MATKQDFIQLDKQLAAAQALVHEREEILTAMSILDRLLQSKQAEWSRLVTQTKYEKQDVDNLQGWTPQAFFHWVAGNRAERLAKETAEYLSWRTKSETCQREIASLEQNLAVLNDRLIEIADCDETLSKLLAQQQEIISEANDDLAAAFRQVSGQLANTVRQRNQTQQAIQAAKNSLSACEKLIREIEDEIAASGLLEMFSGHREKAILAMVPDLQTAFDQLQLCLVPINRPFDPIQLAIPHSLTKWHIGWALLTKGNKKLDVDSLKSLRQQVSIIRDKVKQKFSVLQNDLERLTAVSTQLQQVKEAKLQAVWQNLLTSS